MPSSRSPSPKSPPTPDDNQEKEESDNPETPKTGSEKSHSRSPSAEKSPEASEEPENHDKTEQQDDEPASPPKKKIREASPPVKARRSESTRRRKSPSPGPAPSKNVSVPEKKKDEPKDLLRSRTGGAYIPPAKLRLMQQQISDKSSLEYQKMNWERMKKKIHGLVNRVNAKNLVQIVRELLQENVIRAKGLLCRDIMQAQAFSPGFSNVYAGLVAVINSKFPHVGELILRRLIVQFKRSFRRNDRGVTVNVIKFIAHLINQQVAHEVLALEIMILMLEEPTDDSVEVAIAFLKECGAKLLEIAPAALNSVYDRLRAILMDTERAENSLDRRIQYMIETAMQIRKEKFAAYPAVIDDLDLIEEEDQIIHTLSLEAAIDPENQLNVFKLDEEFEKNEAMYEEIRKEVIGDADISSEEEESEEEDDESDAEAAEAPKKTTEIIDNTDQNLTAFRREVYLTLQSSLDYQEAAHKLLKMKIPENLETELCAMLVDCCAQQRTYERFYGMLIERFCRLRLEYQQTFEQLCKDTYSTVHRIDITKLRNLARLVAHLLSTDAIEWSILSDVKMTEEDTTSAGRIYIKYIFIELVEAMGMVKLHGRVTDPTLAHCFVGLFPRSNPNSARFSINFFTMIGLGGLTLELREWLQKGLKKKKGLLDEMKANESSSDSSSDSSSSDSSDSSSDSSDSDSDSSSDSSDSSSDSDSSVEPPKKKKKVSEDLKKKQKANNSGRNTREDEKPERRREEKYVSSKLEERKDHRDRSKERKEDRVRRDSAGDRKEDRHEKARSRHDRSKERRTDENVEKRRHRRDSNDGRRERHDKDRDRRDRSDERRRDAKERSRSRDRHRKNRSRSREREHRHREEKTESDDRRRRRH